MPQDAKGALQNHLQRFGRWETAGLPVAGISVVEVAGGGEGVGLQLDGETCGDDGGVWQPARRFCGKPERGSLVRIQKCILNRLRDGCC